MLSVKVSPPRLAVEPETTTLQPRLLGLLLEVPTENGVPVVTRRQLKSLRELSSITVAKT